jgi:LysM repeat protein
MPKTSRSRHVLPLALLAGLGLSTVGSSALAGEPTPDVPEKTRPHSARHAAAKPGALSIVTLGAPSRGSTYTVKPGDTLSEIAQKTGVSVSALRSANGIGADGFIRAGQKLVVPSGSSGSSAGSGGGSASSSGGYKVRPGDTVSAIAARFGTSTQAIIAANGLSSDGFIREGQRLRIPSSGSGTGGSGDSGSSTSAAANSTSGGTYRIKAGDTLSAIAARSGTTVAALQAANPGIRPTALQIGQRITVPSGGGPIGSTFEGRHYPAATTAAANANHAALSATAVPSRARMQQLVASTARQYGVDPALAQAIAYQESGFNQQAVSPANAIGTMQVIPSSGQWAAQLAGRPLDLRDPEDNVTAGILILRANLRSAPNQETAIAAYYQGLGSVRNNGMYADTRRYVDSVQALAENYR